MHVLSADKYPFGLVTQHCHLSVDETFRQGSILKNFFDINYIKIDVIQGKIQIVEAIFDVNYAKISFIGLTPGLKIV